MIAPSMRRALLARPVLIVAAAISVPLTLLIVALWLLAQMLPWLVLLGALVLGTRLFARGIR